MAFRIASWNVNSIKVRLPQVLAWLDDKHPDVLALQETKITDDLFPADACAEVGYKATFSGQKTYNGVALLTRHDASDAMTDIPQLADPQRRILCATVQGIRVCNLYVPNGAAVDSDKYQYKLNWLQQVIAFIAEQCQQHERIIVLGDFNIAPADIDVHDPAEWQGAVLVSEPERAALQQIMATGFVDCYRGCNATDPGFSWWDYRAAAFRRNRGLRIDLLLASQSLAVVCQCCMVDKDARAQERPSDHAPVYADFEL